MSDEEYEVGDDPEEDAAVMLESAEADLEDARAEIASLNKSLALMTEARYAERDRLREALAVAREALKAIGSRSPTIKLRDCCDTCLRKLEECDGSAAGDRCPGRIARQALVAISKLLSAPEVTAAHPRAR